MQGNMASEELVSAVGTQDWDPSVKALTAFPEVLAQMDRNLSWTTDLGNAYYNQPAGILEAIQVMRQRAQTAGNLQATPEEAVNYVEGNIELAPMDPQLVYVPEYNPWSVYGQPVQPYPGFSLGGALASFLGSSVVRYGVGIAMRAFSGTPWGWLAWGLSWLAQAVLFNNSNYYSNSTTVADWGLPNGGLSASSQAFAGGANGYSGPNAGYNPSFGYGFAPLPSQSYGYSGGGFTPRSAQAFVHRPPTAGQGFVHRPPGSDGYSGGGFGQRGAQAFVHRPPNVAQGFVHRPPNSNGGYSAASGYGFAGRPSSSYSGYRSSEGLNRGYAGLSYPYGANQRFASSFVHGSSSYGPAASLQRSGFGRSSAQFPKQARSSGFHPFGGDHGSGSFHDGGHAPKMKAPKSYSGHSGGGSHFGGHSSGKHPA